MFHRLRMAIGAAFLAILPLIESQGADQLPQFEEMDISGNWLSGIAREPGGETGFVAATLAKTDPAVVFAINFHGQSCFPSALLNLSAKSAPLSLSLDRKLVLFSLAVDNSREHVATNLREPMRLQGMLIPTGLQVAEIGGQWHLGIEVVDERAVSEIKTGKTMGTKIASEGTTIGVFEFGLSGSRRAVERAASLCRIAATIPPRGLTDTLAGTADSDVAQTREKVLPVESNERLGCGTIPIPGNLAEASPETIQSLRHYAQKSRDSSDWTNAERCYRQIVVIEQARAKDSKVPILLPLSAARHNLAEFLTSAGRFSEAEGEYGRAIAIEKDAVEFLSSPMSGLKATPEGSEMLDYALNALAISLGHLAHLLQLQGQTERATKTAEEALRIQREHPPRNPADLAATLHVMGAVYQGAGKYEQAEKLYREALEIREKALSSRDPLLAQSLNDLAILLGKNGRCPEALERINRAIEIDRLAYGESHSNIATDFNTLAGIQMCLGQIDAAEASWKKSLEVRRHTLPDGHPALAPTLFSLSNFLLSQNRVQEAVPLYNELGLIVTQHFPKWHEATAHVVMAGGIAAKYAAALEQGSGDADKYAKALDKSETLFTLAVVIGEVANSPEIGRSARGELSVVLAPNGNRSIAILFGKWGLNLIQSARQQDLAGDMDVQGGFIKSYEERYKWVASLLIAEGRLPEAQQVLEMLKEAEFFDRHNYRGGDEEEARRLRADYNAFELSQLKILEDALTPLKEVGPKIRELILIPAGARSAKESVDLKTLEDQAKKYQEAFFETLALVKAAFAKLDGQHQQELNANLSLPTDYRALVRNLGPGVALAQYLVLEDQVRILVTTHAGIKDYAVEIKATDLNGKVFDLYRLLRNRHHDPKGRAAELYELLIAPIAQDLADAETTTLMVALDGTLRYLPFAVLYDAKDRKYLIDRCALSVFTALGKDLIDDAPRPDWQVAAFGTTRGIGRLEPLHKVKDEIEGILKPKGPLTPLTGKPYLDPDFTRESLQAALRQHPAVLHIATHFVFRAARESDSWLLLGDLNRLDLHELASDKYPFQGLDLLTLSACETGLSGATDGVKNLADSGGPPMATGKEIEGLGSLAQRRGARAVLATLWPVADYSTAWLMQRFYALHEGRGAGGKISKAEALRQAQLELLRGEAPVIPTSDTSPRSPESPLHGSATGVPAPSPVTDFSHPYFWAPFILMGNWR